MSFGVFLYNGKKRQEKGALSPVGIKNSWKYEKDLTILNIIFKSFTISLVSYTRYIIG